MKKYKCSICGYIHEGPMSDDFKCPLCKQPKSAFVELVEVPAAESELKFYRCSHCGNQVQLIRDAGVPMLCDGKKMELLVPNTVEASNEKHLPVVSVEPGLVKVNVGAVDHPMQPEHYIEWVCLQTEQGSQLKYLQPGQAPTVEFVLGSDKPVAVYAYCNLHGLWITKL